MVAPLIAAAGISAGASLLGGVFGASSAKKAAAKAAAANERQLRNQHQWEVEDLRKAGLNPILSGTGGGGSGTISTPVADTSMIGKSISEAGDRVASAYQIKLLNAQAENLDSNTRVNNQNYMMDKYFKPLERMQGLTSGRAGIAQTKANTANITQTLESIQADIANKTISNEQAKMVLEEIRTNPQFKDFWLSVPYAERNSLDKLFEGGSSPSDWIKALLLAIK